MAAFSYSAPVVGGSEDTWGTTLNQNWANLSTFLGSLDSAELAVLDGITATTAELNILDGVTATAAELNILDGVTATAAEINLLDGVTATTDEINYVDGVTSAIQTQLDAKADDTTQAEADWEAGTSTTESIVSPAKVAAAIEARLFSYTSSDQSSWTAGSSQAFTHGLGGVPTYVAIFLRCTTANNGFSVGDVAGPYAPEGFNDGAGVGYGVVLSSTSATVTWSSGSYPYVRVISPTGSRVGATPSNFDYYLVAQRVAL